MHKKSQEEVVAWTCGRIFNSSGLSLYWVWWETWLALEEDLPYEPIFFRTEQEAMLYVEVVWEGLGLEYIPRF